MKGKIKIIFLTGCLLLVSAGCSVFSGPAAGGIVKTVNGGTDWQFSNKVKDNASASMQTVNVSKMEFGPSSREVIYLGSYNGGLYKSEDSAGSWAKLLSKISVYDFEVNPIDEKIIYAAGSYNGTGKVVKTTDGGASWGDVYSEASANNAVRALAINPANVNQLAIGLNSGNLVISNDGGLSWKLAKNFSDQINRVVWQNGNIYVVLKNKGLQKSSDNGQNFNDITESLNKTYGFGSLNYSQQSIQNYRQVYVDGVSPSLIYLTTDKGLYKTTDGGANWQLTPLPVKGTDAQTRAVAVAKTSSSIVYTNVGSTIYKSLDGGQSFQTQAVSSSGYINSILIDPQLPQIAYAGIYVQQ